MSSSINCRILEPKHWVLFFISDILLVSFCYLQIEESKQNGDGEEAFKLPSEAFLHLKSAMLWMKSAAV
jgi:hypothetical protein